MIKISPSTLASDFANLEKEIKKIDEGGADLIHIDVMDGKFVEKNTTELMKDYALTISHISNLGLDVHLMVENVEEFIDEYLMLEPEILTFHVEATKTEERTKNAIEEIKRSGSRVGISISPDTKLEEIIPYLNQIHMVLVMTVQPGFGGQKYIHECTEKIQELREIIDREELNVDIQVDGGINDETLEIVMKAGANFMVSGSSVFNGDLKANVARLSQMMKDIKAEIE